MPGEHSREVRRLQSVVTELTVLNEIASAISACMSVEEITEIIIDRSLRYIHASQGAVFLFSREQDRDDKLKTFIRRTAGSVSEMPIHVNMNLTGWMAKHKKLLVINAPEAENPLARLNLIALGIKSLLAVPLLTRNGLVGVLAIFNKEGDKGFTNQDVSFLEILGSQCSQVIEAARLYEEEKRLLALREELEIARSIQQSFLPQVETFRDETTLCGFNRPTREVGGDFFDIVWLDNDRVFVSVGDVSGKGVPAALLMSNAIAVERAHLGDRSTFSVASLAANLNQGLYRLNKPGQFITAFLSILNWRDRTLEYVNAGHHPPIIVNDRQLVVYDHIADIVLGVIERTKYRAATVALQPESTVCIFTDGVTETFNELGDEYGERRLVGFLRRIGSESARIICDKLLEDLRQFRGSTEQSDDITAVVFKT